MVGVFEEWKLKFSFSLDGIGFLSFNYHAAWIPDRIGKAGFHCVEWVIMQPSSRLAAFIVQNNLPEQKGGADLQPEIHFRAS